MEFERKTTIIGIIGMILMVGMVITIFAGISLPEYVYGVINIIGFIFIGIYVFESFIVFFKNTDKYK